MSYRADKKVDGWTDADWRMNTQTDAGNNNTQSPKLASGNNMQSGSIIIKFNI